MQLNSYLKFFSALFCLLFLSPAYSESAPFPAQILMNIYQAPSPLKANDKYFLVYEIFLTNYMKSPAKLTSFGIDAANNKNNLFSLKDLSGAIQSRATEDNKLDFNPGETKTIYVWLPFDKESELPEKLLHHLSIYSSFKDKNYDFDKGTYPLLVDHTLPVIITPPLQGKNWLAGNAPSNTSDHRRTAFIKNGIPFYAQRYAIDFVQIGEDGKSYSGDPSKNTSYHCYNQDLHAVAEGTVVQLQDGVPENIPNSKEFGTPITEKTLPGNYLVLDIGNGRYAGYAHIIPGSFKVKIGDHVARNQVLAKLGNSGNSSEPHLHFQIINNKSFLLSNGVPYGFKHFFARPSQLLDDPSGSMKIKVSSEPFKEYSNQLVLENALINFDA